MEIKDNDEIHTDQFAKGRTLHRHFCQLMGTQSQLMPNIHWEALYKSIQDNLAVQTLDHPITIAEIENVISHLPNGKMVGPDGFPSEFYKAFKTLLLLNLLATFHHVTLNGISLSPLNTSYTVLIPKKRISNFTW
jgi:hypothetical protein